MQQKNSFICLQIINYALFSHHLLHKAKNANIWPIYCANANLITEYTDNSVIY